MECKSKTNKKNCNCTYPCGRKGICCDCISYHRSMAQLPACYFPDDVEPSGDRSVSNFMKIVQSRGTSFLR